MGLMLKGDLFLGKAPIECFQGLSLSLQANWVIVMYETPFWACYIL